LHASSNAFFTAFVSHLFTLIGFSDASAVVAYYEKKYFFLNQKKEFNELTVSLMIFNLEVRNKHVVVEYDFTRKKNILIYLKFIIIQTRKIISI